MTDYKPPLSVFFVWHPADEDMVKPLVSHCSSMLQRDVDRPFSRGMNLPVFYRTSLSVEPPQPIDLLSAKSVIFLFVSADLVVSEEWVEYVKQLPQEDDCTLVPVALEESALALSSDLGGVNFIRAYDYASECKLDSLFIAIAHEIYRFALNENFDEKAVGTDNAVKLFLSHAKHDKWAVDLAQALKNEIDHSAMQNFFDAYDIAIGYQFDEEIRRHISDASVIAIHSDTYSSRYWCQRELLTAKELERPIIAVDCLDNFEDRRFPYSANMPAVHIDATHDIERSKLLNILSAALLETIRHHFNKQLLESYRAGGWYDGVVKAITRPPEVADLNKLLRTSEEKIRLIHDRVVYPEPPVYTEELRFLENLGIAAHTPLTIDQSTLSEHSVGISISDPTEEELITIGLGNGQLIQLSQDISRHLLSRKARVVYGGDLRPNGFTDFILNEAMVLQDRLKTKDINVDNYLAWPIYNNDSEPLKEWKLRFRDVTDMRKISPPEDVTDLIPFKDKFLKPINPANLFVWSRCLTHMRKQMIDKCTARICAGGKSAGYKGKMPGVLEEILIAIEMKKPLFLLGGFGGITARVCEVLLGKDIPAELKEEWQVIHNAGYADLIDFAKERGAQFVPDYESIGEILEGAELNNGLTANENRKLWVTPFVDEALHLVLRGMKNIR